MPAANTQANTSPPLVSILLSVKDGEEYLDTCLRSIAQQTYSYWEIVIVNDGSTDDTEQLITQWKSSVSQQVHVIHHSKAYGLTVSLNEASARARGVYLARIDADDTWHESKLEKQINFLETNPDVGIVGTWYVNITNAHTRTIHLPVLDKAIKKIMFRKNPFGHSCVVMRKTLFEKVSGYDETLRYAQDRDLWFRLRPHTSFVNIPEVLVRRLSHPSKSQTHKRQQIISSVRISSRYIREYHAPVYTYLFLLEPLIALLSPMWLRTLVRKSL